MHSQNFLVTCHFSKHKSMKRIKTVGDKFITSPPKDRTFFLEPRFLLGNPPESHRLDAKNAGIRRRKERERCDGVRYPAMLWSSLAASYGVLFQDFYRITFVLLLIDFVVYFCLCMYSPYIPKIMISCGLWAILKFKKRLNYIYITKIR